MAKAGYMFVTPPTLTVTINGNSATINRKSDTEITVSYTFPPASLLPYTIKPSSTFEEGNASDIVFTVGEGMMLKLSELKDVSMGGRILNTPIEYIATPGSIIITLKQSYLNTLKTGTYVLRATMHTGSYAETQITVFACPPKTGDSSTPVVWLSLCLIRGAGFAALLIYRMRRA